MLRVGLIGFGFMGRMHFDNYERLMSEGKPVKLAAICDISIEALKHSKAAGNMATGKEIYDLSDYRLYGQIEDMLANEQLDLIDITVPTPLHAKLTCSLLEQGYHVICEKPAARHASDVSLMVQAAKKTGKQLLIAQCLRFWPAYEYLKETIVKQTFGEVTAGYFFRGSGAPKGWFMNAELSGGNLLDMHIHDTDMINWLFGLPERVSTLGKNVVSTNDGFDIVSTHYYFPDGKVINAQSDWTLEGDHGFDMTFRVNFEKGNIVLKQGQLKVNPNAAASFTPELSQDDGYYRELDYMIEKIMANEPIVTSSPESALVTLKIIEAEDMSAKANGEWVSINL